MKQTIEGNNCTPNSFATNLNLLSQAGRCSLAASPMATSSGSESIPSFTACPCWQRGADGQRKPFQRQTQRCSSALPGVRVPRQTRRCLAKQAGSAAARGKGTSPSSSLGKVSCAICCLTSSCLDSLCSPSVGVHERFGRLYVLGGCCSPGREHGRELTLGFNLPSCARQGALSAAPGPSRSVMRGFHGSPLGQGKPNGSLCLFLLLLPCPAASRRTDVLSNRSLRSCSLTQCLLQN